MARIYIKNADIVLRDSLLKNSTILINGTKIISIGEDAPAGDKALIIDAKGYLVCPGFIDSHIHGSPEEIFANEARSGTTSIVVAMSCDKLDRLEKDIVRIRRFVENEALGPNVLGIHLEGPYISKKRAGAQSRAHIKKPDKKELLSIIEKGGSLLKLMTIAPELEGAPALIKLLVAKNIKPSIGHSESTYEEASRGIGLGIRHATHIFNCMPAIDRRLPGAACAVLLDGRVSAEIILDSAHVHPALFELLLKVKSVDNIILITDSVRSMIPNGARKAGRLYRFKDGRIAGSSLTMIEALKNAVRFGGISILEAARMVSLNPARLLGIEHVKGSIRVGADADLVVFDRDFDVKLTAINGKIVYRKKGF